MAFYKKQETQLLEAPNFVYGPYDSYHLTKEDRAEYEYPVDGWYWFDSIEEAYTFFDLPVPPQ